MKLFLRALPVLLAVLAAPPARASVEEVLVRRCDYDSAIVQRGNGDLYRLDLRQDCRSLMGYQGRRVLMLAAAGFPGPEMRVLIPEQDLACRIFRADSVGHAAPPRQRARPRPDDGLRAVREALELLGYNCGPRTERGWSADAAEAFLRYRESRKLDASDYGVRRAVTALAIDVMRGRQVSGTALRLSTAIADQSDEIATFLWSGGGAGAANCTEATFIRTVSPDSSFFALGDGTVWDVMGSRRGVVASWPVNDGVMVCAGRFVNLRTGEMAKVTRLR